jgi:hypothetical protein
MLGKRYMRAVNAHVDKRLTIDKRSGILQYSNSIERGYRLGRAFESNPACRGRYDRLDFGNS